MNNCDNLLLQAVRLVERELLQKPEFCTYQQFWRISVLFFDKLEPLEQIIFSNSDIMRHIPDQYCFNQLTILDDLSPEILDGEVLIGTVVNCQGFNNIRKFFVLGIRPQWNCLYRSCHSFFRCELFIKLCYQFSLQFSLHLFHDFLVMIPDIDNWVLACFNFNFQLMLQILILLNGPTILLMFF